MKKLPIILLVLGLIVVAVVFLLIGRGKGKVANNLEEESEDIPEIALSERPLTTLTPKSDGHWLFLNVKDIKLNAKTLDYELLYTVKDGRQQGVPGSIELKGEKSIQRELLLGSESSGKFRYDEGVQKGTLTLKFRNDNGKVIGRLETDFNLYNNTTTLASSDGKFTFELDKNDKKTFYVVMNTFGVPSGPGAIQYGPYAVLPSDTNTHKGKVTLSGNTIKVWDGATWEEVSPNTSVEPGIFISL